MTRNLKTSSTAICGFSLVEMAMVIVVLTIILTVIAQPIANQVETRRIADTQKKLEEVKEALYGFALVERRLPRPAMSATNGIEMGVCASEVACTGFIPWTTLGIDKSDAWGSIIRYTVTPAFASNTRFLLSVKPPPDIGNPPTKDVVTRNGGGALPLATGVVAVVWSHGKRNWGMTDAVSPVERPNDGIGNIDETHNRNTLQALNPPVAGISSVAGTVVFSRLPSNNTNVSDNPGGEFDDLVSWIPTSILMGKMLQAGQLP